MGIDSKAPWIILPLNGATQRKMTHVCGGFSFPLLYGVSKSEVKSKSQDKILPFKLTWVPLAERLDLDDAEQSCVQKRAKARAAAQDEVHPERRKGMIRSRKLVSCGM